MSGAKSVIPLTTVIAVCVGAFVGAGILICFSVWFYRRSLRARPRARQKQPLAHDHGVDPAAPWTRFDDGEDKWEGRSEMAEKKGGSNATLPQITRQKPLTFDDRPGSGLPFSQYPVKLAEERPLEPPRPVGANGQSRASGEGSTTGTLLTLGTVHIESGTMSPTFNVAKVTPPATTSRLHQWESAEVINPDDQGQEIEVPQDPFSEKSTPTNYSPTSTYGDRRSFHNPFFNAHPGLPRRASTKKYSTMTMASDPFGKDEIEVMEMPKPKFVSHVAHDSSSSGGSLGNEKAMQNLIAALHLPQEVIEERLRVASMQPSEASRYSTALDSSTGYAFPISDTEEGYVMQ